MIRKAILAAAIALLGVVAAACTPSFVAAPTGVPVTVIVTVVLTPTPLPEATVAPLAPETAVTATSVAAPAATLAPAPTLAPTSVPSTTPTPPATATRPPASATPTSGPSPTRCPLAPSGHLGAAWTVDRLQQTLGCPLEFEKGVKTSFEPFQHGFMFWRDDTRHVYVAYDDGTWQEFPDTWVEGQAEYSCPDANTPSETPPTPRRGIGKVWCAQPEVRAKLGNALQDEIGNDRVLQDFQNGMMILFPERGDMPVVLVKSTGRWQQ